MRMIMPCLTQAVEREVLDREKPRSLRARCWVASAAISELRFGVAQRLKGACPSKSLVGIAFGLYIVKAVRALHWPWGSPWRPAASGPCLRACDSCSAAQLCFGEREVAGQESSWEMSAKETAKVATRLAIPFCRASMIQLAVHFVQRFLQGVPLESIQTLERNGP